jgi:Domain of unknown function (DUF4262)
MQMSEPAPRRAHQLRETALDANDKRILDDLETHPCSVVQVREEGGVPGWSNTVGLFETLGQPEVIVIGLREDLALSLLNHIAGLGVDGKRFNEGYREKGLLSTVECEFRSVENRWLRQIMGYAVWFQGGATFPVLQCVYADLSNRFPWDEGSTAKWRQRQPLLFPNPITCSVEQDFWAANDPESSLHNWKLPLPPHTGVYTTKRIVNGDEPVTHVFHDSDDNAWQFHGTSDQNGQDCVLVCLHHLVDKDRSIETVFDLLPGWSARRDGPSKPWVREMTPLK